METLGNIGNNAEFDPKEPYDNIIGPEANGPNGPEISDKREQQAGDIYTDGGSNPFVTSETIGGVPEPMGAPGPSVPPEVSGFGNDETNTRPIMPEGDGVGGNSVIESEAKPPEELDNLSGFDNLAQ